MLIPLIALVAVILAVVYFLSSKARRTDRGNRK